MIYNKKFKILNLVVNNSFPPTMIMKKKTMLYINLNVHWEIASQTIKKPFVTLVILQQNYQGGSLYTFQILASHVNV